MAGKSDPVTATTLRLPNQLRKMLAAAREDRRTMTAEIAVLLEDALARRAISRPAKSPPTC